MSRSLLTIGLVLGVALTSTLRAQDTDSKASTVRDPRQPLVGVWALVGRPGDTAQPKPDAEMKFLGLGHFAVTKRNAETGGIDYHHVGTYTLEGDQYSETITHALGATEQLVGKTYKFRIHVAGDSYIQHGLGNPWTQQWRRLGAIKEIERDASKK